MYQFLGDLIRPDGGWLLVAVPSVVLLCLHWREEKPWQHAWPFLISIILSVVVYRLALERSTVDPGLLIAVSGLIALIVWWIWRHPDLREHTVPMASAIIIGVVLYRVGFRLGDTPGGTLGSAAIGFGLVLFVICAFHSVINRTFNDFFGGLLVNLIFSDGAFGDKYREPKKLPNVGLLRLWRKYGRGREAYRLARRHLAPAPETYPLWLFAAESAALDRDVPAAERFVRELYHSEAFSRDHKLFALLKLREWADAAHFNLDAGAFPVIADRPEQPRPLHEADRLREQGRIDEAEAKLRRLLDREPDNLSATLLLMRIYAQDKAQPKKAEQALQALERRKSAPNDFIDFAWRLLGEWNPTPAEKRSWFSQLIKRQPEGRIRLTNHAAHAAEVLQAADERKKTVAELLAEGRLETAEEKLQRQLTAHPNDFNAWLQLLELHALYIGSRKRSGETFLKIVGNPKFTQTQKERAEQVIGKGWGERLQPAFRLR